MALPRPKRFIPFEPPAASETETEPERDRDWRRNRLRLVTAVVLGLVAVLGAGWFASSRVRDQIDNRLQTAGAGANAGLIAIESEQLTLLRALTFTQGAGEALASENAAELNALVTPLQTNSGVPMVDCVLPDGKVIFAVRSIGAPRPLASRAGAPVIAKALATAHGTYGGRFSEVTTLNRREGPLLLTVGPALVGSQPVGVFIVATPLADVLARLAAQSGATMTAYNALGQPTATTSTGTPPAIAPAQATPLMHELETIDFRELHGPSREAIGRLIVVHQPEALLGTSMPDDSWVTQLWVDLIGVVGSGIVLILAVARRRRPPVETAGRRP